VAKRGRCGSEVIWRLWGDVGDLGGCGDSMCTLNGKGGSVGKRWLTDDVMARWVVVTHLRMLWLSGDVVA
jgi:hypothetical protein